MISFFINTIKRQIKNIIENYYNIFYIFHLTPKILLCLSVIDELIIIIVFDKNLYLIFYIKK